MNEESFRITSTRKTVTPRCTDTKNYGEICEIKIEASTEIVDLFLDYIDNFDKHIRRKLKRQ